MTTRLIKLILIIFLLLSLWQLLIWCYQLPSYLLPSPYQVLLALYQQSQVIAHEALPTLFETLVGFVGGILLGCFAAAIIAYFRPVAAWFLPILIISQAIPTFVIAPLLVMWLGFGMASKIVTTLLMIFFPITSALYDGLRRTPSDWLDLADTMNASAFRIFWMIRIPAALPALASGIRIAAVSAPIGAIVGEWVGSSKGLGYLMLNANAHLQIDMMFAVLLVIIVMALLIYFSVDKLLQRWIWWEI